MDKSPQKPQNVIAMAHYQPESGYGAIAQVEAYWQALRGNRMMPKRSEIDPRGIESALEHAFIIERIAPGVARLRIAGSRLSDLMGMEVRGMPITSLLTQESRRNVSTVLEEVFQTPAISVLNLVSEETAANPRLEGRMIFLPLKSDLGDVSRVLGCLVAKGDIGFAPRRFAVTDVQTQPIQFAQGHEPEAVVPQRPLPTPTMPPLKRPAPESAGFAEPKTPFEPASSDRRPPYLRLVKSDE